VDLREEILKKSRREQEHRKRKLSLSSGNTSRPDKRQRPSPNDHDYRPLKTRQLPLWGDARPWEEREASRQRWEDYRKETPIKRKVMTRVENSSGEDNKSRIRTAFHRTTKEEVRISAKIEDIKVMENSQSNKRTDIPASSPLFRCKNPPTSESVSVRSPERLKVEVVKPEIGQVKVRHVSEGYM
jgi:hypothetical protein